MREWREYKFCRYNRPLDMSYEKRDGPGEGVRTVEDEKVEWDEYVCS